MKFEECTVSKWQDGSIQPTKKGWYRWKAVKGEPFTFRGAHMRYTWGYWDGIKWLWSNVEYDKDIVPKKKNIGDGFDPLDGDQWQGLV